MSTSELDSTRIDALTARNRSWDWNFGQRLPFTAECEHRFPWGSLQVHLAVENGVIRQAKVYSDAMDWSLAPRLEAALSGCRLDHHDLAQALADILTPEEVSELLSL